jgi:hypothetical protein
MYGAVLLVKHSPISCIALIWVCFFFTILTKSSSIFIGRDVSQTKELVTSSSQVTAPLLATNMFPKLLATSWSSLAALIVKPID